MVTKIYPARGAKFCDKRLFLLIRIRRQALFRFPYFDKSKKQLDIASGFAFGDV